jgi:hypothetical protein
MRVKINQQEVFYQEYPTVFRSTISDGACDLMFASSQFPYLSDIWIEVEAQGLDGSFHQTYESYDNRNRAYIAEFFSGDFPYPESPPGNRAHQAYEDMFYAVAGVWDGINCTEDDFKWSIYRMSSGFMNVHGFSDRIPLPIGDELTPNEILGMRHTSLGVGDLPPYNVPDSFGIGGYPMVDIMFLNACHTGVTSSFAYAFLWPGETHYGTPDYYNQAFVGWDNVIAVLSGNLITEAFYEKLRVGHTASEAAVAAEDAYLADCVHSSAYPANIMLYGDPFARLIAVYTGSIAYAPDVWFRRI